MAVTVVTSRYNTGVIHLKDVYADATDLIVTPEGNLLVQGFREGGMENFGVYPAGGWKFAFTNEDAEPKKA